jgi:cellulose synthase/poly-beta-1,6-N-acetylglucosamine synthase-like glycosyltransferase
MKRSHREPAEDVHSWVDNTQVDLYTSAAWPHGRDAGRCLPEASEPRPSISLIATVRNEEDTIKAWLDSLLAQTRLPDEIVLVDGGSTDSTFDVLEAFAGQSSVPVIVFQAPGANIARGRNLAIEQANGPIIACTDAGCLVPPSWLATISGPFAADPAIEVAAGYYDTIQQNDLQRVMSAYFVRPPVEVDPQSFLPSTRSLAFRKEVWYRVGGFPEWLTLTAEDTLFDIALKEHTSRWAFVPEAVVLWRLKSTVPQLFRQVRIYGRGDGEAGLFPDKYRGHMRLCLSLSVAGALAVACLLLALFSQSWLWLPVAFLPTLWLARRLWRMTLRPSWPANHRETIKVFVLSATVACTIMLGLAIGFAEGVRSRRGLQPGGRQVVQQE